MVITQLANKHTKNNKMHLEQTDFRHIPPMEASVSVSAINKWVRTRAAVTFWSEMLDMSWE